MKRDLVAIVALLGIILLLPMVKADEVNVEIHVNGTSDINLTIDADDTLAREQIGELQEDVYGTAEHSSPEDIILQTIEDLIPEEEEGGTSTQSESESEYMDEIADICNNPIFADYFDTLSSIPPEDFIQHMKDLGYDDVAQIGVIWSMCQSEYISSQRTSWLRDESGIDALAVAGLIGRSVDWLLGINSLASKNEEIIGRKLDSYFASDKDVYYLNMKVNELELRLEALERTMEGIASDAYCQGKLGLMLDYNMRWVRCGDTQYHNHLTDPATGEEIVIGITPIENGAENGGSEETDISFEEEDDTIECSDIGKPKNSVSFCTSYTGNYWCGFGDQDAWYMKNCIRKV